MTAPPSASITAVMRYSGIDCDQLTGTLQHFDGLLDLRLNDTNSILLQDIRVLRAIDMHPQIGVSIAAGEVGEHLAGDTRPTPPRSADRRRASEQLWSDKGVEQQRLRIGVAPVHRVLADAGRLGHPVEVQPGPPVTRVQHAGGLPAAGHRSSGRADAPPPACASRLCWASAAHPWQAIRPFVAEFRRTSAYCRRHRVGIRLRYITLDIPMLRGPHFHLAEFDA